jgi:hypothetical protein
MKSFITVDRNRLSNELIEVAGKRLPQMPAKRSEDRRH